jgi:hypothetical protein
MSCTHHSVTGEVFHFDGECGEKHPDLFGRYGIQDRHSRYVIGNYSLAEAWAQVKHTANVNIIGLWNLEIVARRPSNWDWEVQHGGRFVELRRECKRIRYSVAVNLWRLKGGPREEKLALLMQCA